METGGNTGTVWIMYGTGVGVCVLFMALHIGITAQANRVYSENSEINRVVNRLTKRAWTSGLVYASWIYGAVWITMAAGYYITGPYLPAWLYAVYSILLTGGAAALLEDGMTVYVYSREEKETEEWYDMLEHIG